MAAKMRFRFRVIWALSLTIFLCLLSVARAARTLDPVEWLSQNQDSFTTGLVESQVGFSDHKAFTYDVAIAAIAFTKSGNYQRSKEILDKMQMLQELPAGYWRDAYLADTGDVNDWNISTGPVAWMVIAVNYYESQTGDSDYNGMAEKAISWLETRIDSNSLSRSYGALNLGEGFGPFYSTEHQFDAYSAFRNRAILTQDSTLKNRLNLEAEHILAYLVREPWKGDHFERGFDDHEIWLDCHSWAAMALGRTGPNGEDFVSALDYAYATMSSIMDFNSVITDVQGFSRNNYDDTVWVEGTAQMANAYQLFDERIKANYYLSQMARIVRDDNGLSYSFDESGTPDSNWPLNLRYSSVSSAVWYYFAKEGFNPFELASWEPLLLHESFESVEESLSNGWSFTGSPEVTNGVLGDAIYFPPAAGGVLNLNGNIDSNQGAIEFWFNPSFYLQREDTPGVGLFEIGQLGQPDSIGLFVIPYGGAHVVVMEVRDSSGKQRQSWTRKLRLSENKWHHVVMTWQANQKNNYIRVFVNGRAGSKERGACRFLNLSGQMRLAKVSVYYNQQPVKIDDLRILSYIRNNGQIHNDYRHPTDAAQPILTSPETGTAVEQTTVLSWLPEGFDRFRIEIAQDRNFTKPKSLTSWSKETNLTVGRKVRRILALAKKDNDKVLYWRVLGLKKYAREYSTGKPFILPANAQ